MVVLAQLAEHRIVVPSVVGSSPTFHPKNKSAAFMVADFVFCWSVSRRETIVPLWLKSQL